MTTVVTRDSTFEWSELPRPPGDTAPPGQETILHRSRDRRVSCGFWKRVPEAGALDPPFDEIMMILQGDIEVTRRDGEILSIGPGDVLAAPNGAAARWHSFSPVYKFWVVHHGEASGHDVIALHGSDFPEGAEKIAFKTPSGSFRTGLRRLDRSEAGFEPSQEEILLVVEGAIEVDRTNGSIERVEAGDVIISPETSSGTWKALGPARLFWAVYRPSPGT